MIDGDKVKTIIEINKNFLVSIIIPVYNGSKYMCEAIDSALNQTYSNIEIIVINDGSKDNGKTRTCALSYGNKIRYFEKVNGGVSTALNLGIKHMKGEYFSWLSHDDVYYPRKIESEINALRSHGDMTLPVYSGWATLKMPENKTIPYSSVVKRYSKKYLESGLCATVFGFISGCSLLIHKSYFEKYGSFNENLRATQDYEKWFQMFRDKQVIYVEDILIKSRIHAEQVTETYSGFLQECDELHVWMLQNIDEQDVKKVGLDLYQFYSMAVSKMICFGFQKACDYAYNKLFLLKETPQTDKKINVLKTYLYNYQVSGIYLYCAGSRGKALLESFRLRGISVDGISDSNEELWNLFIDGVKCVPPNKIPKDALVIVTKDDPDKLKESLQKDGILHVITYDDLEEYLIEVPVKKECLQEFL